MTTTANARSRVVEAVDAVRASVFTIPTDAPEADGTATWDATTTVVVEVDAGGRTGTGWTYATGACKNIVDDVLADIAVGSDPMNPSATWRQAVRRCRNLGRPGVVGCALSALDVALWDLKARLLDLPLCRLLGQIHGGVPVYGSGGFTSYDDEQLVEQLRRWVEELAIPRVKIKIGESWGSNVGRDLARVALTRDVVGAGTEVYVDANGGYAAGQAVRVARELEQLGVTWFEEPVSSDDLTGLATVRHQIAPDVTAGEYAMTSPTSSGCARRGRSTASKSTSPDAAASPSGCAPPLSQPRITSRSARTARQTCTRMPRRQRRTFGTSSTSTITSASRSCCSKEHSLREAALCAPTPVARGTDYDYGVTRRSSTGRHERRGDPSWVKQRSGDSSAVPRSSSAAC